MIKSLNLKDVNARFEEELIEACTRVIKSGWYTNGEEKYAFEERFADYIGVKGCVGVGNGFDSLNISLRALKEQNRIKDGDGVIVQANTFIATVLAIYENNLIPILAEPDILTCNLTVESIEKVYKPKAKVILPVHLYGRVSPMIEIIDFASNYKMIVIEDAAQAHGAQIGNIKAGAFGYGSCFSFYPGKNLGALGDAGAICSNDRDLIKVADKIANYGAKDKYRNDVKGVNSRLDDIQAAMLSIKLKYLDDENRTRRAIAKRYNQSINNPKLIKPIEVGEFRHVYHQYVIRVDNRDDFIRYMNAQGVEVNVHYPHSIYEQRCFDFTKPEKSVAVELARTVVSLPVSPSLSKNEIERIIAIVNEY